MPLQKVPSSPVEQNMYGNEYHLNTRNVSKGVRDEVVCFLLHNLYIRRIDVETGAFWARVNLVENRDTRSMPA
jgi:hypothetical protein